VDQDESAAQSDLPALTRPGGLMQVDVGTLSTRGASAAAPLGQTNRPTELAIDTQSKARRPDAVSSPPAVPGTKALTRSAPVLGVHTRLTSVQTFTGTLPPSTLQAPPAGQQLVQSRQEGASTQQLHRPPAGQHLLQSRREEQVSQPVQHLLQSRREEGVSVQPVRIGTHRRPLPAPQPAPAGQHPLQSRREEGVREEEPESPPAVEVLGTTAAEPQPMTQPTTAAAGMDQRQLEELAGRLFTTLMRRIRSELLIDRERRGIRADRRWG
jgi:hypothetical protein